MALKLPFTQNCTGYQGNISNSFYFHYFENNTKLLQSVTVSLVLWPLGTKNLIRPVSLIAMQFHLKFSTFLSPGQ
jgi:hypothetical protein